MRPRWRSSTSARNRCIETEETTMAVTELPTFVRVTDAWGNPMHLRPDAVQAVSAVLEGDDPAAPPDIATKHPDNPYRVVTLAGGTRILIAASEAALQAKL